MAFSISHPHSLLWATLAAARTRSAKAPVVGGRQAHSAASLGLPASLEYGCGRMLARCCCCWRLKDVVLPTTTPVAVCWPGGGGAALAVAAAATAAAAAAATCWMSLLFRSVARRRRRRSRVPPRGQIKVVNKCGLRKANIAN